MKLSFSLFSIRFFALLLALCAGLWPSRGDAQISAYTFEVVHNLSPYTQASTGTNADGTGVGDGLAVGDDGYLYGTATYGGANATGTVFRLTPAGDYRVLHTFGASPVDESSPPNTDGIGPASGLTKGADGKFYGITYAGGANNSGTLFVVAADGNFATLSDFTTANPGSQWALVIGADGAFYAYSARGGDKSVGAVLRIVTDGTRANTTVTQLHSFGVDTNPFYSQGSFPEGRLLAAQDGNLYGTTFGGGDRNNGTIFKLTLAGDFTKLYEFTSGNSSAITRYPEQGLTQIADGSIFGTASDESQGSGEFGAIYRVTTDGTFGGTTAPDLRVFHYDGAGGGPSQLVEGADGSLYGTLYYGSNPSGSPGGAGALFRMTPDGAYSVIHYMDFVDGSSTNVDGFHPRTSLTPGPDGKLYGATDTGGPNKTGTIFRITLPGKPGPVSSFALSGPTTVGSEILFTATADAAVAVRVQATSTPDQEGSWTDLPGGGAMTENAADNPGAGSYALRTTSYPLGSAIYFRAVASKPKYLDSISAKLGPNNLAVTLTLGATGPAGPGDFIHFSVTTVSGFQLRVQASATPDDEGSWSDLAAPNAGRMTEDVANPGNYALDSASYPAGAGYYFRAVASKTGYTDIVSARLGDYTLDQATLTIGSRLTSTSDQGHGTVAHVGEDLTFAFDVTNTSATVEARSVRVRAVVPVYTEDKTDLHQQFSALNVTNISSGGHYVAATSSGANDAAIVWDNLGDLASGGQSLTCTYTVHLPATMRVNPQQDIGSLPAFYSAGSAVSRPPVTVTGNDSHAPVRTCVVSGPISFTVTPRQSAVAPGGLFSYLVTLKNLGAKSVLSPVAVIEVPDNALFAENYNYTATGGLGLVYAAPRKGAPAHQLAYYQNGTHAQVVITFGALTAVGKSGDSVSAVITFQAKWVSSAEVTKLALPRYAASFFLPDVPAHHFTPRATLNRLDYNHKTPGTAGATDFIDYVTTPGNGLASLLSPQGEIDLAVSGNRDGEPFLEVFRTVSNQASDTYNSGDEVLDAVFPGQVFYYLVGISNTGDSDAASVFIEDSLPDQTTFKSAVIVPNKTKSALASALLKPTFLPDHRLLLEGLTVKAHDSITVAIGVLVASGPTGPVDGDVLDFGGATVDSLSTPRSFVSLNSTSGILVQGVAALERPTIRSFAPAPTVTSDPSGVSLQMSTFYDSHPKSVVYDGPVQRYYIHYRNSGTANATDATLEFPLPSHTAFYRASFVSLVSNAPTGGDPGLLPGTLIANPAGTSISVPDRLATSGTVKFKFAKIPPKIAASEGNVMVEVIVTSDAVQQSGSYLGAKSDAPVLFYDQTGRRPASAPHPQSIAPGPHTAAAPVLKAPAKQHVNPSLVNQSGVIPQMVVTQLISQRTVHTGDTILAMITVANQGIIACEGGVTFWVPDNVSIISVDGATDLHYRSPTELYPYRFDAVATTNNVPATVDEMFTALKPNSAGTITVTMQVTGSPGQEIVFKHTESFSSYAPNQILLPYSVRIVEASEPVLAPPVIAASSDVLRTFDNGVALLDLGAGNIVAQGGGNIVAQGGGNIVAQGGGNIVAQGGGNAITLPTLAGFGVLTGSQALLQHAAIVGQGGGNVLVGRGGSIVAQGGGNVVGVGTTGLVNTNGSNIVAQGGLNIVAQGGGNLVNTNGSNLVNTNGSNIVAQGGGNLLSTDGGRIVAQGGGNFSGSAIFAAKATPPLPAGASAVISASNTSAMVIGHDGTTYLMGHQEP